VTAWRATLLLAGLLAALAHAPAARADAAQERALAARYAPVVRLVAKVRECGPTGPYLPIDVDLLFGEPTVALRGPWGNDLVAVAPKARDLAAGLYQYHLDFPGSALDPGCDYLRWQQRLVAGHRPAVYAHVVSERGHTGKLALQYWLFYVFNDWNNLHEGDWEVVQLVFDAATPAQALQQSPVEVGYSQHEGAEGASWDDDKLELAGGTHPVVHPAAGSHANFFGEALYLGASGQQGVGCDDTRGPTIDLRPQVVIIPSNATRAEAAFPWIAFEGRWGELHPAFFNGPEGPNLKTSWTKPITWSEGWRSRSYTVPGGTVLGPGATGFFCTVVGSGSSALVRLVHHPLEFGLVLAGLALLVVILLSRATWRPTAPLRLAHRRGWGQVLTAAGRMYAGRVWLFLGIGVLFVPISLLVTLLQAVVLHATSVFGVQDGASSGGVAAFLVLAIGTALTLLVLGLVQAACAQAMVEIDADRPVGPVRAYRLAAPSVGPLFGALLIAVVIVSLLASSFFLLPVAVWVAGRCALIAPVIELEGLGAAGALRRSSALTRRRWLKVATLIVAGAGLVLVAGPLVGVLLIVLTDLPLGLVNVIAGAVYALAMPYVAIVTTYVYVDARIAREQEADDTVAELPAEIRLTP
jgi:hypothetical protein